MKTAVKYVSDPKHDVVQKQPRGCMMKSHTI